MVLSGLAAQTAAGMGAHPSPESLVTLCCLSWLLVAQAGLGCAEPLAGDGAAPPSPVGCTGLGSALQDGTGSTGRGSREGAAGGEHAAAGPCSVQMLLGLTSPQAKAVTALTLLALEVLKPVSACELKNPIISHRNTLKYGN